MNDEFLLSVTRCTVLFLCGFIFGTDRVIAQNLRAVALTRGLYVICNAVSQVYKHSDPACLSRELPGSAVLFSGLSAPVNEEFLLSFTRCTVCLVLSAV